MIKIENKQTSVLGREETLLNYSVLIESCCNYVNQATGVSSSDQLKRLKILSKIDGISCGGTIELEDAEFNDLLRLESGMAWGMVHRDIGEFTKYLNSLKK